MEDTYWIVESIDNVDSLLKTEIKRLEKYENNDIPYDAKKNLIDKIEKNIDELNVSYQAYVNLFKYFMNKNNQSIRNNSDL